AASSYTEFALANGPGPTAITAGPDGNVWFSTGGGSAAIGRIDQGGSVTLFSNGLTSAPVQTQGAIAGGPDGNVWFIEQPGGTYKNGVVGRVTPAGAITEMSTGLVAGLQPTGITTGADGNLWVTDSGGPGTTIVRLTPGGAATDFTPASLNGLQASDPVAGADGNVWFLLAGGSVGNTGAIGRVTTGGTVTLFSAGLTNNGHLSGLASGPDGNLWFAQSDGGAGGVGFITPAGAITELPHAAFGGTQPVDLVTAADGAVYVTEAAGHGAVVRVTSDGTVTPAVANSAGTPGAITAQPGGDVWIAETGTNNIGRLVITPLLPTGAGGPTGATGTTGSTGGDGSAPAGP
ncbi:MAG TPA: hypothetical protein VIJ60_13870, partial [Acidimicrobiales bacterium]